MDRGIFLSTTEAESTTFAEVLRRYSKEIIPHKKSQRDMLVRIKLLDAAMGHLSLAAITPSIVKEYRDYPLESVGLDTVRKDNRGGYASLFLAKLSLHLSCAHKSSRKSFPLWRTQSQKRFQESVKAQI